MSKNNPFKIITEKTFELFSGWLIAKLSYLGLKTVHGYKELQR